MVKPNQRPRGPMGFSEEFRNLPWPSDVTIRQVSTWAQEWAREVEKAILVQHTPVASSSAEMGESPANLKHRMGRLEGALGMVIAILENPTSEAIRNEAAQTLRDLLEGKV